MEPHGNVNWQPIRGTVKASNMHFPSLWPETFQTFVDSPDGGRHHVTLKKVGTLTSALNKVIDATYEGVVTHVGTKFVLTVVNDL